MVQFRWIAVIALYTLLIGPVVGVPNGSASRESSSAAPQTQTRAKGVTPVKEVTPRPR